MNCQLCLITGDAVSIYSSLKKMKRDIKERETGLEGNSLYQGVSKMGNIFVLFGEMRNTL